MKLLIIILLFPFISMAQKPSYDTVKVIIVYCDTTEIRNRANHILITNITDIEGNIYSPTPYDNKTYWMKGYEVIEVNPPPRLSYGDIIMISRTYLDADKKPLSKNIIVWQSKTL